MRHIVSLCKLIDYLKTVTFFTLKTSQCKKGKNADSKKYTLSVQCFHRSLIFKIYKILYEFSGHRNGANLILTLWIYVSLIAKWIPENNVERFLLPV